MKWEVVLAGFLVLLASACQLEARGSGKSRFSILL